jgi:hypothetical protein
MKLDGFLVFPSGCNFEVKGWLVWLLGAGRCNGDRPFFMKNSPNRRIGDLGQKSRAGARNME